MPENFQGEDKNEKRKASYIRYHIMQCNVWQLPAENEQEQTRENQEAQGRQLSMARNAGNKIKVNRSYINDIEIPVQLLLLPTIRR